MFHIGPYPAWTVVEAIAWRLELQPPISQQEALSELHVVCSTGRVRAFGTRCEAHPEWPNARKIEVRLHAKRESVPIPTEELAELWFALDGQLHWENVSSRRLERGVA